MEVPSFVTRKFSPFLLQVLILASYFFKIPHKSLKSLLQTHTAANFKSIMQPGPLWGGFVFGVKGCVWGWSFGLGG